MVSPFRYQISYIIYIILTFVFIQIHTLIPITIFRMIFVCTVHYCTEFLAKDFEPPDAAEALYCPVDLN